MNFRSMVRQLFKIKAVAPKGKLRCADCDRHIHRHDKYRILAVQHVDCGDPKKVGQTSLPRGTFPPVTED